MKRITAILIAVLLALNTSTAFADTCATSLMPAFTANQATQLCRVLGSSVAISLVPQSDNAIDLGSASKTWRTLYTGTSRIAKTSDILRVRQDAQRLFTWDGSSDTALTMTFGDAGTTAAQVLTISGSTADADDDSTTCMTGGGAISTYTRGSAVCSYGNEVATLGGFLDLWGGGVTGADVRIRSEDDFLFQTTTGTAIASITELGAFATVGTITSSATSDLGWSVVAGANTACNTTCTSACVVGQDAGNGNIFVNCASALADVCICAGAS